jgi:hypothetical protein
MPEVTVERSWFTEWQQKWVDMFALHRGIKYAWQGGRDAMHLKRIHQHAGGDIGAFVSTALRMLTTDEPFYVEKGVNLGMLDSQWNRLRSMARHVNPNLAAVQKAHTLYDRLTGASAPAIGQRMIEQRAQA